MCILWSIKREREKSHTKYEVDNHVWECTTRKDIEFHVGERILSHEHPAMSVRGKISQRTFTFCNHFHFLFPRLPSMSSMLLGIVVCCCCDLRNWIVRSLVTFKHYIPLSHFFPVDYVGSWEFKLKKNARNIWLFSFKFILLLFHYGAHHLMVTFQNGFASSMVKGEGGWPCETLAENADLSWTTAMYFLH